MPVDVKIHTHCYMLVLFSVLLPDYQTNGDSLCSTNSTSHFHHNATKTNANCHQYETYATYYSKNRIPNMPTRKKQNVGHF
jgi:hypothetical protein